MKKFLRGFLIIIVSLILIFVTYVLVTFPPIMGGMAAKVMCSCVFVTGRSPETVTKQELQVFPGLDDLSLDINHVDSTVTARLLWHQSKAIYRKGLGCTLLSEATEEQVRKRRYNTYSFQYPDQDTILWPMGDMQAFGYAPNIDRDGINRMITQAFIDNDSTQPANTHAVIAVYNGKIIGEKYADGFGPKSVLMGWSMTKSITNALIGILVKQNKLDPYAPAPVEAWANDDRKNITLNHLLQASSGLSWSESYFVPGADFHNMFIHSDDKAAYAISRDLEHTPGEYFQYSSGTTNILSKIIRQTVGEDDYHRFPYESLFAKIGMYHAILEPDASGTFVTSSYGYASARDWARLGLLYLNDGVWNGERILPEGWVGYSTTPASAARRREYGAQMWLNLGEESNPNNVEYPGLPHEAIVFDGFEKNYVVIIPSKDLIVVRLGVTHNRTFDLARLVRGISDLLPDPDNLAKDN